MFLRPGQVVADLVPSELVVLTNVQALNGWLAVDYTGLSTRQAGSRVLDEAAARRARVITEDGAFDFGGDPARFLLAVEAERQHAAHLFDPLWAVTGSLVDALPHQVEAVYRCLLPQPSIRFLLADDTGAGKTIMTGLLLKELLRRGRVERVLIVTPGGLTRQWQEDELAAKFDLPFTLLNRRLFATDPASFSTASRVVTSIDFLVREDVLAAANRVRWDLVVVDEAHKLSAYEQGPRSHTSRRYAAVQRLAGQCEHLLLLTATPHRGRADTFRKLLQLLDPDVFATDELAAARVREPADGASNPFFLRRLKEDMRDWQGQPLYRHRFTQTVAYELNPAERQLYEAVTAYLTRRRTEAAQTRNPQVALALTVMQRRLVSSLYAIRNTLRQRLLALQGVVDEATRNPTLWQQRHSLDDYDADSLDEYDELGDDERQALEALLADPRRFRLFTTARSLPELQAEAREVQQLYALADALYGGQQAERKYEQLLALLTAHEVAGGEKLVIFTEHKDTLDYLAERLTNNGYRVATIHGGKTVDERRQAQRAFAAPDTPVLVATDAAGEGINLQFCRLLLNWDIPWNPNRLEQRMGRIHRYGQQRDVLVFNLVARNTREGQVLERLLSKLDIIRRSLGDDRVYDVIQDVLEDVRLEAIFDSVLLGRPTALDELLTQDEATLQARFAAKIDAQQARLTHSPVDYGHAHALRAASQAQRLPARAGQQFFERVLAELGGAWTEARPAVFHLTRWPTALAPALYSAGATGAEPLLVCFDQQVALTSQREAGELSQVQYLASGHPLFDALVQAARHRLQADRLRGAVLASPAASEPYLSFWVRIRLADPHGRALADERLHLVRQLPGSAFTMAPLAELPELQPPAAPATPLVVPAGLRADEVVAWAFEHLALPQLAEARQYAQVVAARRRAFLDEAFTHAIVDLTGDIAARQGELLLRPDGRGAEQLAQQEHQLSQMLARKQQRLRLLEEPVRLAPQLPEVLGCAWVLPPAAATAVSLGDYGMRRDEETEAVAMRVAMAYETAQGWLPTDVSAGRVGYDLCSIGPAGERRYIEVKGRSGPEGSVMLSDHEWQRLTQLGAAAWLYIVVDCKSQPTLHCFQNPAARFTFEQRSKGFQYFLPMRAWQNKLGADVY